VRWVVKGNGTGAIALPDLAAVRGTLIVGTQCATHVWNQPGGVRPRCDGDTSRVACR
jgi:hypothetical protein